MSLESRQSLTGGVRGRPQGAESGIAKGSVWKTMNDIIVAVLTLKTRINRLNSIQKKEFLSNLFLNTPVAIGRYSRPSYSGAMGIMSKKTEWNGIFSFLNTLKSE